jgi:DNA-binding transcriptional regulator YiaG
MKSTEILIKRVERGYTRRQLADIIGVSHRTVESWEYGIRRPSKSAQKLLNHLFGGE